MHLIHNERTKLTATWLNTLATALIAAGALAPAAANLYGLVAVPVGAGLIVGLVFGYSPSAGAYIMQAGPCSGDCANEHA